MLIAIPRIPKVLFLSGKGGVGKSTDSTMTAEALAKDLKVGLVDLDVDCPNVLQFLSNPPTCQKTDTKGMHPGACGNLQVVSLAFELPKGMSMLRDGKWRAQMVNEMVSNIAWDPMPNVVVFDMPPGTNEVHTTILQYPDIIGAVIVTTGHPASLEDAARAIDMLHKQSFFSPGYPNGVPILGAIDNMSAVVCPKCSTRTVLFGKDDVQTALGIPVIAQINFVPGKGVDPSHFEAVAGLIKKKLEEWK